MSLENAPDEIKLAVDLIMLLEENNVPAQTVLAALEIIRRDYENKVKKCARALAKRAGVTCRRIVGSGSVVACSLP